MTYKKTVVAFLDILGTKNHKDFESKHKIHRVFHESIRDCQSRDRKAAAYYRKVFSFSDCAYIFHGLRENNDLSDEAEELLIQTALLNTTITTIRLLNDGYLVRGGIAYDNAYYDDMSFFGPAVEEAFFLESKVAVTPRIIISDHIGERAKIFSDRAHLDMLSEVNPSFKFLPKRSYIPELIQRKNNTYQLNQLYILEMESKIQIEMHEFTHKELKKNISANIESQISQHPWESPVRAKLEWMREYVADSKCSLE